MLRKLLTVAGLIALPSYPLLADFTYEETSTITGGAIAGVLKVAGVFSKQAREPIHSTVAVKGNKMAHRGANEGSIIDLDTETITTVDLRKKTYSVMTFQEMKQMLDQLSQKMKQNEKGDKADMNFKVSAENTGKTQQIGGAEAKELIMKMEMQGTDKQSGQSGSMVVTNDMWIGPAAAGYQEVRTFQKKMAEKLAWTPGGNMFMGNPEVAKGMAEVAKEVSKLDGIPLLQNITMGGAGQPGAAPAGDQPPAAQQQESKPSIGGALGGALGGRFGIGRRKKQDDQPAPAASNGGGSSNPGSMIEMKTEMSGFSAGPADASLFAVPAGFKKVDPPTRNLQ